MSHKCQIEGSSVCCIEKYNELWVKEFYEGKDREGRTYRVKFCPECGFKIPKVGTFEGFFGLYNIPNSAPDNRITQFSKELSTAIAQINHNLEVIKCFMSSQNTQNQLFMDRDREFSRDIEWHEIKIKEIEKHILGNIHE